MATEPFQYEYNAASGTYLVRIGECNGAPVIWKIPNLDIARRFWPVKARRMSNGRHYATVVVNGRSVALHRLLLNAHNPKDQVKAWDGDLLNVCKVSAKQITESPNGRTIKELGFVDNLFLVSDANANPAEAERQRRFENTMSQVPEHENEDGSIAAVESAAPQRTFDGLYTFQPGKKNTSANPDLGARTGAYGRVVDCGPVRDYRRERIRTVDGPDRSHPRTFARAVPEAVLKLARKWGLPESLY